MPAEGISLKELAEAVGGTISGDPDFKILGVCSLDQPRAGCLAYAKSAAHLAKLDAQRIPIAVVAPCAAENASSMPLVLTDNPRYAFAMILTRFFAPRRLPGISSAAQISGSATIRDDVTIGAGCVIGDRVEIGEGTELRSNVVLGDGVRVGRRCLIKSNSVVGEEGFGFESGADGRYLRFPHLGSVVIGDDVEIGALNTIARGTIDDTVVGDGTKTDDHVHIAHNCKIGRNVIITAHAELSGSIEVLDNVWIGPNSSLMNGITIAAGSLIGIGAVVTKSTVPNGVYPGGRSTLLRVNKDSARN